MRSSMPLHIVFSCLLTAVLAACQAPTTTPTVRPDATLVAATQAAASPTPAPSPTPETARVLFIAPETSPGSLQAALQDLAASSSLQVVQQSQLTTADLTANTRVVVAIPPDPGLAALAAQAPQVQFLAVGIPGVAPAANVSVITAGDTASQTAFLAGYISVLVTPEWRAGVVATSSSEDAAERDAFLNGGHYLCGICNIPVKPYFYPIAVEVNAGDVQAAVDGLKANGVDTAYVVPSLATPEMLSGLAQAGISLVGVSSPSKDLTPKWIATIHSDPAPALKSIWAGLLSGKGNHQVGVSLSVSDAGAALSAGRMRLVEEVIQNLSSGYIEPKPVDTGS